MYRCVLLALALGAPLAASAQVQRNFPQSALRGEVTILQAPDAVLNGRPARLAPGARIRGGDNMIVMAHAVVGQRYTAYYTVDTLGLLNNVWLLRVDELSKPWPATAEEAARLAFDPIAQTWTRP